MYFSLPSGLRTAIFASCCISSITSVYAHLLTPAEYLDLIDPANPDDYWTLNSADVANANFELSQSQQNGASKLGSLDAPSYGRFVPSSKRQTTSPWGGKTTSNCAPSDAPNTGVIRSYNFTITNTTLSPDGVPRTMLLVNGQFPGPTIEANWGDTISVTVQNNLATEGTSLHWHGMLQTNTNYNDGVPGVTQCPIAPGQSYTYTFQASLYGTSWYHAHYSAQYISGLFGAMIIHGPSDNAQYDVDLGPVMLTDYYYDYYYNIVEEVMGTDRTKVVPSSDNNLINGKGFADCANVTGPCTPNAGLAQFQFTAGKTHRLRVINAGAEGIQKFSIDGHTLQVMALDFTPVVPYETTVLTLAVGQRADILVKAIGTPTSSYWMRSTISTCSKAKQPNALALVFYQNANKAISPPSTAQVDTTDPCSEGTLDVAVPAFSMTPTATPDTTSDIAISIGVNSTGHFLWYMNNSTFRTDYSSPVLSALQSGNTSSSLPTDWNLMDFGSSKSVRIIVSNDSPVAHPMHLHGYDMFILNSIGGPLQGPPVSWDGSTQINAANPLRRDTYLLPPAGYMVMQFQTTNVGVWPFHCHIAWHVSGGLYNNFVTQSQSIAGTSSPSQVAGTCAAWNSWTNGDYVDQIDSGL